VSNKKAINTKKTFVSRLLYESKYEGTRAELAKRLGITEQKLWNWCNIHDHIPYNHIRRLASLCNVTDFKLASLMLEHTEKKIPKD